MTHTGAYKENWDSREHDYCPNLGSPYLYADDGDTKTRLIIKARCKLWTCPYCSQVNKHQHYIRILNGSNRLLDKGHQLNFVTLTSHETARGFDASYSVFKSAWKKLSQRARRKNKKTTGLPFEFVYIPEIHKDNTLHWHGVFTGDFSKRWWKDNSRQSGMGYMAECEPLENAIQATNYCLKYITKHLGQEISRKGFRRINYSRGFPPKPVPETLLQWQIAEPDESLVSIIETAWRVKNHKVILNGNEVTEIIDNR